MSIPFKKANILLPKKGTDMTKWAVVACDQYTSEMDYWNDFTKVELEEIEKIEASGRDITPSIMGESGIGKLIKVFTIALCVLCFWGCISIWAEWGAALGITAFISSSISLMLLYAAGEVCCLLASINAKLSK